MIALITCMLTSIDHKYCEVIIVPGAASYEGRVEHEAHKKNMSRRDSFDCDWCTRMFVRT
jgi:hypothetical protein